MSDEFGRDDIKLMMSSYRNALKAESDYMLAMQGASEAVEFEKTRVLSLARANGQINGKNEGERAEQAALILENTPGDESGYWFLCDYALGIRAYLTAWEIRRKALEAEISLTKAWLYSLSGIGK